MYRIKNWRMHFENCESKKLKRMFWVAVPNKMDGDGYTWLVDHPNGAAHFGAWIAIVEIASKQVPAEDRGNLPSGIDGDISRSLGRISRLPRKIFEEVLPRLLEVGWIEEVQSIHQPTAASGESPGASGKSPASPVIHGMEWNGMEEETHTLVKVQPVLELAVEKPVCVSVPRKPEPPVSQRFLEWLSTWPACADRDGACRAWVSRVTPADEDAAFACRDRYLASDQVSRGCIQEPKKFITVQADSNWSGTWISDASELDPSIKILKEIERKIKEEDDASGRNGSPSRNGAPPRIERLSETASRSGISARINGKVH